ncbi:macrophage mannose receptor 1-like [Anticarsia gemmatalis]|uniref:macrophage mannose receptor 1-like n=1 Tax=Anticarsia gemmatalis TaxID=129554 RepID=UPI003F7736EE
MVVNMLTISVCVLVLFVTSDVQGRYVFESTIRGSIETNKIISSFEDAASQCKTEGAVLAAPVNDQIRNKMIALIGVNNHSTPYFINAKLKHSHNPEFVSSEGVSLDDMSVSDMIEELDPRDGECLAMDSRTIRVVSCSAPLPYMCYKENDITTPVGVAVAGTTETERVNIQTTTLSSRVEIDCGTTDAGYKFEESTGSCYKLHSQTESWYTASSICTAEGGYLVILNDENEARVIRNKFFPKNGHSAYIGLRDYNDNDMWTSVHGDDISRLFNQWHEGHDPNTDLNCGALDSTGKLNDYRCTTEWWFVCEKDTPHGKPTPTTEGTVRTTTEQEMGVCGTSDPEYRLIQSTGSCYKFHPEKQTWDDANSICTAEGGYLAILNDENEARVMRSSIIPENIYNTHIGLRDYNDNDIWTSVHGDDINSLYNVWHEGHDPHTDLNCATINSLSELDDYRCENTWSFVCEKNPRTRDIMEPVPAAKTVIQTATEPEIIDCGTTDTEYKLVQTTGSCYKKHADKRTWDEANSVCTTEGGYLVIINDENEARMIRDRFISEEGYAIYIGLRDYNDNDTWTSVHGDDISSLHHEWHDGHALSTHLNCATLNIDAKLDDYRCENTWSFVCEKNPRTRDIMEPVPAAGSSIITDASTTETVAQSTTEQEITDCGTTDTEYKLVQSTGSCYKTHAETRTWDEANSVCTAEGGYLVIINDENEARIIRDRFISEEGYATYIGLRDYNDNDTWTSVHGDDINSLYNVWYDIHASSNHWNCATLNIESKLDDYRCENTLSFVCEKNPRTRDIMEPVPAAGSSIITDASTTEAIPQSTTEQEIVDCGTTDTEYKLVQSTGSCYKHYAQRRTWDEANIMCTAEGGYLVILNDEHEARVITEGFYSEDRLPVYIGLRDFNDNDTWTSVHGDDINSVYNVWHQGHDPQSGMNCGALNYRAKLDDYRCYDRWSFVCEKNPRTRSIIDSDPAAGPSIITDASTTETVVQSTTEQEIVDCDTTDTEYKFVQSTGSCYKTHTEKKTWDLADSICTAEGGYLVIINDEHEARIISERFIPEDRFPVYIGIRDFNDNDIWTSVHGDDLNSLHNVWHDGHDPHSDMNCGTLNYNAKLDDYRCHNKWSFVCEKNPRTRDIMEPVPAAGSSIITDASTTEAVAQTTSEQGTVDCGKPDTGYELVESTGSCYKLHPEEMTWDAATSICYAEGGYPAIINDENEARIIFDRYSPRFAEDPFNVHIGIRDIFEDDIWMSVHGDVMNSLYNVWHDDHRRHSLKNCGTLDRFGKLKDVHCSTRLSFICEKDMRRRNITETVPAPVSPENSATVGASITDASTTETVQTTVMGQEIRDCDTEETGYELVESTGSCYKQHPEDRTWDEANEICTEEGGYLVILNDENEARIVRNRFFLEEEYAVHIGLRDYYDNETWTSVHGDDINSLYNVWHERHNLDTEFNCGTLAHDGKLDEFKCDINWSFVCEKKPQTRDISEPVPTPASTEYTTVGASITAISTTETVVQTTTEQVIRDCNTEETGYKFEESTGSCYKFHSEEKIWDDANSVCTAEGGYLVILNDENEARIIRNKFFPRHKFATYIGLRDYHDKDIWKSVHGDDISSLYHVWHDSHSTGNHLNCAVLDHTGKLNDFTCNTLWSFVCEKNPQKPTPQTPEPMRPEDDTPCGTFDQEYELDITTGSCYKFHGDTKSWYAANATCLAEGGYLAVINNGDEAQAIYNKKYNTQGLGAFIGLHKLNRRIGWISITGIPFAELYNVWKLGHEPSGRLNCAIIDDAGRLEDQFCIKSRPFICEKEPPKSRINSSNNNAVSSNM